MTAFFRRLFRASLLLPWLVYMAFASLATTLKRDKWEAVGGMTRKVRQWGRGLLWIFNIRLKVSGDPGKYNGGLVVSNHLGYIDVFVHSAVYGMRFAPKAEIRSWPVLGLYTSFVHPVWVDRSSRMKAQECVEEFKATLEHRIPLIVYPEGTSTDGLGVLPFKSTPFESVADGAFPVQPILTVYRVPRGADTPCWFGDITLFRHLLQFLAIPRIDAEVYILPEIKTDGLDRKQTAQKAHDAIETALAEVAAGRNPAAPDQ